MAPSRLSVTDLKAAGKAARQQTPRAKHSQFEPGESRDIVALLKQSNSSRLRELVPIRIGRMAANPFAFLRGSAVVMASDLASTPVTGIDVQACGDLHLLNFGMYATPERNLVFDINDFDETLPAAWEWDLKRLAVSFDVATRQLSYSVEQRGEVVMTLCQSFAAELARLSQLTELERWYLRTDVQSALEHFQLDKSKDNPDYKKIVKRFTRTVEKAQSRTSMHALAKLTRVEGSSRVIVDTPPTVQRLTKTDQLRQLERFLKHYRDSLNEDRKHLFDQYEFVDAALKVVGVGSVGTRAFVVLLTGKADNDALFLQIKEAQASVLGERFGASRFANQGQRVVEGQRLLQAASDIFLGWGSSSGRDYYVRQLRDMKGSFEIEGGTRTGINLYAQVCGAVTARAYARSIHPAVIAGYLGNGKEFGRAMVTFAKRYGDQTEIDHQTLVDAIDAGKIKAERGV